MKTLLLADRNLFSYSFISALPLSLEKCSLCGNTEASVEFVKAHVLRAGEQDFYSAALPRLNSAFSLFSSLMV